MTFRSWRLFQGAISMQGGLRILAQSGRGLAEELAEARKGVVDLDFHPFDLVYPIHCENLFRDRGVKFIDPAATDSSVNAMIAYIRGSLGTPLQRLRVIYAQCDAANQNDHIIYFEVWSRDEVFITGNCSDYTNTGAQGTLTLLSVFALLSIVHGVEIESVEVFYDAALKYSNRFFERFGTRLI